MSDFFESPAGVSNNGRISASHLSIFGVQDDIVDGMDWVLVASMPIYGETLSIYAAEMGGQVYLRINGDHALASSPNNEFENITNKASIGVPVAVVGASEASLMPSWSVVAESERASFMEDLGSDAASGMCWQVLLTSWAGTKGNWAGYWATVNYELFLGIYGDRLVFLPHVRRSDREADDVPNKPDVLTLDRSLYNVSWDGGLTYSLPDAISDAALLSLPQDFAQASQYSSLSTGIYNKTWCYDEGFHTDEDFNAKAAELEAEGHLICSYDGTSHGTMTPQWRVYLTYNETYNAAICTCISQNYNKRYFSPDGQPWGW